MPDQVRQPELLSQPLLKRAWAWAAGPDAKLRAPEQAECMLPEQRVPYMLERPQGALTQEQLRQAQQMDLPQELAP